MQTEFRLLARLTHCGRNANYCVMRTAGAPRGGYLRIPPSLAATGFQEMRPAFALDVASKGDAVTGINRADSASVKRCSISGDLAHRRKRTTRVLR